MWTRHRGKVDNISKNSARIAYGKQLMFNTFFAFVNTFSIISQVVSKMHVSGAEYMKVRNLNGEKRKYR